MQDPVPTQLGEASAADEESAGLIGRRLHKFDIDTEQQRTLKIVDGLAAAAPLPPALAPYVHKVGVLLSWIVVSCELALPHLVNAFKKAVQIYRSLPTNAIIAILGFLLCFSGGMFPTLMAAGEAVRICGWDRTHKACASLRKEFVWLMKESQQDDQRDDDGDGIPDVDELDAKTLLMRKARLVMTKCQPEEINTALAGLFTSWMGVIGVLKAKFARTIALAITIGDFVKAPCLKYVAPLVSHVVPQDYHQWIPVVLGWFAKSIGIAIAWSIERVLSAVHSGMRGGIMCSRAVRALCVEKGWTLNGYLTGGPEETYFDDVVGWSLALLGFLWQLSLNFAPPFPLNVLLAPLSLAETILQWHVTSK